MSNASEINPSKVVEYFETHINLEEFRASLQKVKDNYIKCYLAVPDDEVPLLEKQDVRDDLLTIDSFCEYLSN